VGFKIQEKGGGGLLGIRDYCLKLRASLKNIL